MLCKTIIEKIEELCPPSYACEWDNSGMQAGRLLTETDTVYVALDATDEVIAGAKEAGAKLLVTHHPLLFGPVRQVTDSHFTGRRLMTLLQADVCCYAAHTNYDTARMGDLAAGRLGLQMVCPIEVTVREPAAQPTAHPAAQTVTQTVEKGIGAVGELLEEMTLEDCCALVKKAFGLPAVRLFGNPAERIKRAAILPGSGKDYAQAALEKGAQVLITGDIGHHEGLDAMAQGLCIIDAGHYGLEHIFIEDMGTFLKTACPGLCVKTAPVRHPFQTI